MAIYVETMGKRECTSKDLTVHDLLRTATEAVSKAAEENITTPPAPTPKLVVTTCIKDTLQQLKPYEEVK